MKVDLVDHEFDRKRVRGEISPEQMKEKMKKIGLEPPSYYNEKPFYISSTGALLDAYVPPEGDGKVLLLNKIDNDIATILGEFDIHFWG